MLGEHLDGAGIIGPGSAARLIQDKLAVAQANAALDLTGAGIPDEFFAFRDGFTGQIEEPLCGNSAEQPSNRCRLTATLFHVDEDQPVGVTNQAAWGLDGKASGGQGQLGGVAAAFFATAADAIGESDQDGTS